MNIKLKYTRLAYLASRYSSTPISQISVCVSAKVGIGYRSRLKMDGTPDQPSLALQRLYEPSWVEQY